MTTAVSDGSRIQYASVNWEPWKPLDAEAIKAALLTELNDPEWEVVYWTRTQENGEPDRKENHFVLRKKGTS